MTAHLAVSPRTERDLIAAVRPFSRELRPTSWWHLGTSLTIMVGGLAIAAVAPWWPLRVGGMILGSLVMARCFIVYHDYMHGAVLRGSATAKVIMVAFGLFFLTPPRSWALSHNFHHANVGKLAATGTGSFPLMTTAMWRQASTWSRFSYRFMRHPLTILGAYVTVFAFTITVQPLLARPRQHWDSAVALLVHAGSIALLWWLLGPTAAVFALIIPFAMATALGAYLFYAQHDFPGMRILPLAEWSHARAALSSCSFLGLGRVMRWFTGNIGYHHIHHLNAAIPFYRLAEAYDAVPELQRPPDTTLRPRDVIACLRLKLWDEELGQMVTTYPPARS